MSDLDQQIRRRFAVKSRDLGQLARVKGKGMHFAIRSFTVEGLGFYSTISMSAMLGLMKMQTLVFTPLRKDAPLFSYDRIHALGRDTLLLELYDTQLAPCGLTALDAVKASAADLADHDLGTHWYDHLKLSPSLAKREKGKAAELDRLTAEYLRAYLDLVEASPVCDPQAKQQKTAAYVDGLFTHGGPSTDQFVRMLGQSRAKELFGSYVFSSAAPLEQLG